jgi:hypothetical protein
MGKQVAADFGNGEGRCKERWDGMAGDEGVTGGRGGDDVRATFDDWCRWCSVVRW